MSARGDLMVAFELHSPEKIRAALDRGADPSDLPSLIRMYSRSTRFAACIRTMLDAGAKFEDPLIECILLDDTDALRAMIAGDPATLRRSISLNCTFTPLKGVTALHLAAEYNCLGCEKLLLEAGADVNAPSTHDGHTPVFHTVNSMGNFARESMELLVNAGANLDVRVTELIWGEGFEWETSFFDLTPISYAQCGLYPQVHRKDTEIYSNIAFLFERRHGRVPVIRNVPNKYLRNG